MTSNTKTRSVCQRPKWGAVSSTCRVIVIARVSARKATAGHSETVPL